MYPVSDKYKAAIRDSTRKFYYNGKIVTKTGTEYPFENKDIVKGSAYVTNQCCGDSEIEIGSVYAAELGITLYSSIDRYTLEGAEITLSFFLQLEDGTYEEVPLGIFEISEANRTVNCLAIKAYDYMLRFDKDFNNIVSSGTAYQLLALACENCDVELVHTEEEIMTWKNGSIMLGIYSENDIETWRDVIYYVAQVLGCFCTINREGKLELRKYGNTSVETIESRHRFSSSFSDFVTRYTAISSTNNRTQEAEYYALEEDDGLTMNLGINPLLQFGLVETRKDILTNVLNDISVIRYVPFDSVTIGNPAFDLGDVITFSGGHADGEQITCITKYEFKVNGQHTLKCVGKNPRLAQAKSKNDKNITGLLNSVEAGRIAVHTFMNASPYTIGSTDTEIASIEFASNEDTDAQFHGSIGTSQIVTGVTRAFSVTAGQQTCVSFYATDEEGMDYEIAYEVMDVQAPFERKYLLSDKEGVYYRLEHEKAFVDAIELKGYQFFRTGIIPDQDTKVVVSFRTSVFNDAALFGARESTALNKFGVFLSNSTTIHGQYNTESTAAEVDEYLGITVTVELSKEGLKRDGVVIAEYTEAEFTAPVEMTVGTINTNETLDTRYFRGLIFKVEVWQGEEQVLNLIPCVDEQVRPCFYDTLSEVCYYNDGYGTFGFVDEGLLFDEATHLVPVEIEELTAEAFHLNGFVDFPRDVIFGRLVNPTLLYWQDSDTELPVYKMKLSAVPPVQTIYSKNTEMTDSTILGIEKVVIEADDTTLFAFSFDGGEV